MTTTKKTTKKKVATKPKSTKKKLPNYVHNEKELAERLGISRSTIGRMKGHEKCPEATADNRYLVSEWVEFKKTWDKIKGRIGSQSELKLQLLNEKIEKDLEKQEIELEELRGRLMSVDEVCQVLGDAFLGLITMQKNFTNTLAPEVSGLSPTECMKLMREANRDALGEFALGEWAKKKRFWDNVYVILQDLQATYSHGSGQSGT